MAKKTKDELYNEMLDQKVRAKTPNVNKLVEEEANESAAEVQSESALVSVLTDMLPTHIPLPCSVYVKVAGKFVLFRNQGERLTNQRAMELQGRNVDELYIHKAFWKMFMDTLENLDLPEPSTAETQAIHVRHLLIAYGQELDRKIKEPKKPAFDKMRERCAILADKIREDRALGVNLLRRNHDPLLYFVNHSANVAVFATLIGIKLRLSRQQLRLLTFAGLVHNVGNLYMPKRILFKEESNLTEEEKLELQSHTRRGAELLQQVAAPPPVVLTALQHHERWDGTGHPSELEGEEISLFARIVSIADAFDELTSCRPGSDGIAAPEALKAMRDEAGRFDPKLLDLVTPADLPLKEVEAA